MSSPAVYFTNPGVLDPRLIVTFGANVKASESAIGTFGTGLKYAIATTVRNGGTITIESNKTVYTFAAAPDTIRGKQFDFITMTSTGSGDAQATTQTLAFTTELGKNWKPWMVYRELWSNCKDESGVVSTTPPVPDPAATIITVRWSELFIAHNERSKFLIRGSAKPLFADSALEVYSPSTVSPGVYYRGILVTEPTPDLRASKFTYNILEPQQLTEDRTLPIDSALSTIAYHLILRCNDLAMIDAVCDTRRTNDNAVERALPFDSYAWAVSPEWKSAVTAIAKDKSKGLSHRSMRVLGKLEPARLHPNSVPLESFPPTYSLMWTKAKAAVQSMGYEWDNIQFAAALQGDALGQFYPSTKTIFISAAAFRAGTKQLVMTLLEECIHAQCGAPDFSRQFQEALLGIAVDQYEQRIGSPL